MELGNAPSKDMIAKNLQINVDNVSMINSKIYT